VLTTGRHAAAILFGAVAPATGQVVMTEADQATAQTFQAFLDTVLATFPDKTIHLVLDLCRTWDYADQVLARLGSGCVGGLLPNFGAA